MIDRRSLLAMGLAAAVPMTVAAEEQAEASIIRLVHPDGRETGYRVLTPSHGGQWGFVVFSHGAKSSYLQYDALLQAWTRAGIMIALPNHLDHDGQPLPAGTAPGAVMPTRIEDAVLPFRQFAPFAKIARERGGHVDPARMAIAGHSYGGLIAQIVAGAHTDPAMAAPVPLPAVACVLAFSPPGIGPADSWSGVHAPAFLETGDRDVIPGFIDDWRQHKRGFEDDPGRNRWLAIGSGVDHFFGGLICNAGPVRDPSQRPALDAAGAASADFLRAWLLSDPRAKARLAAAAYGPRLSLKPV